MIQRAYSSENIALDASQQYPRTVPHKSTIQSLDLNDPNGRSNRSPSAGYSILNKANSTSNSDLYMARFSSRDSTIHRVDSNGSLSGSRHLLRPIATPHQRMAEEIPPPTTTTATALAEAITLNRVPETEKGLSTDSVNKPAPNALQHKKSKLKIRLLDTRS
ncbi:hypothetical protein, variant [Sphaeroforma arctica JP610]|uniref:Uncharacterized protein n=1 Tax=Sphaeroforma arctica JP610 TaxID=667725 RepID=A0A0L0FE74_9EUKA|nr:hypothetical protein, variant [Sphaeroforma arctica JP610]KNC75050.1 hypothetical protein, variant [Sphaeroforma arctica JP610]|eukprot:XP_014148952.1 hypothetical protein, variant [Sphaeroforma arctica JP610]